MTRDVPRRITDHYKVTMRSSDTVAVVTCRYCLRQFKPYDIGGRLNWFGAMTHTAAHARRVVERGQ